MQCRDPSVRHSRDVKLAVADFVVCQNHFQKFREDAISLVEEQLTVRRGRSDNDITALFSLGTEVAIENVVHRVHRLRTAAESQDGWICLGRILAARKDGLVMNGRTAHRLRLLEHIRLERLDQQHCNSYCGSRQHPVRAFLLHREAPSLSRLWFAQSPLIEDLHIDAIGILDVQTGIRIVFRTGATLSYIACSSFLAEAGYSNREVIHNSGRALAIEGDQRPVGPEPY